MSDFKLMPGRMPELLKKSGDLYAWPSLGCVLCNGGGLELIKQCRDTAAVGGLIAAPGAGGP